TFNNIAISQTTAGTAFFGTNPNQIQGGTSGSGGTAQINLVNQNVNLNVPNTTGTITINKGVTITADPQVAEAGLLSTQINAVTDTSASNSNAGSKPALTMPSVPTFNQVFNSMIVAPTSSSSVVNTTNVNASSAWEHRLPAGTAGEAIED